MEAMDLLKLALTTPPALVSLDYTKGAGDIIFCDGCKFRGMERSAHAAC